MSALLDRLKEAGEDHEWYPSTEGIVSAVAHDMKECRYDKRYGYYDNDSGAILDIGSGDGRVLRLLQEEGDVGDLFAIEKSNVHIQNMPKDIIVLGTEFWEQTLVDKPMRYIFCNPPYSEYEGWMVKIIRECNTKYLYMVVPRRWDGVKEIKDAIKLRSAEVVPIGEFDFEDGDRKARAKVDLLRITFDRDRRDVFDTVVEDMFPELEQFDRDEDLEQPTVDDRICQMIESGENMIASLVKACDAEVNELIETYRNAVKISPTLLKELGVTKSSILTGIRQKITGLKHKYWEVLFDRFKDITKRLATKQRKQFLNSLNGKATIDFTEGNILSMLVWVTKHANDFFDEQLIDLFRKMTEHANVVNYKSNERVWQKSDWRYNQVDYDHYKLEYRQVLEHVGGVHVSQYGTWEAERRNGLSEGAYNFISDLVTVANNLGFDSEDGPGRAHLWESNVKNHLRMSDGEELAAIRAFKNQNLHVHVNQRLMLAINVEAGRLLGWLKSPEDAVDELKVDGADAEFVMEKFGSSFRIESNNVLRLGHTPEPQPEVKEPEPFPDMPELPPDMPPLPVDIFTGDQYECQL